MEMSNTINHVSHQVCTGCSACYNICPKGSITMQEDQEGFLFPIIQSDSCIDCGACLRVCPAVNPIYQNNETPKCFAVMASDEIRKMSSSGGVFSLLSEWILDKEGVVCGAAYTENYHNVEHVLISEKKDLQQLRGSKYVQSRIGNVFQEIRNELKKDRYVLFTGCPCQVAGLKKYLGKDYDKLYTADLVCHGTPPLKMYRQFIEELEEQESSHVTYVSFRDKEISKWTHSTTVRFENGAVYFRKRNDSSYMNAFLTLLSLRKSCGQCQFARLPRQGDVTMADFWDIHRYDPSLDDQRGTSAVLVNNEKGEVLLNVIKEKAQIVKEAPLEHAIRYNSQIKYSSIHHKDRKRLFELLYDYHFSVDKAVDWTLHRHFDIGYIGWWYGANYGSVMTSFALNRVLKHMGKTVLMLDFPYLPGQSGKKMDSPARRFGSHFYETSMRRQVDKHGDLNHYCDSFLVGSDQLWNWWSNKDIGTYYYFLDFADSKHKKIAYSTSFGHEDGYYPEEMRVHISYLLHRFDAISVREGTGVDICRDQFGVEAVQRVDPVLLCEMEDYEEAMRYSQAELSGSYILAYILNPTEDKLKTVRYTAEQINLPYYIIIDGQGSREELKKEINDDEHVLSDLEMADWLSLIKKSSYVITDSYHGFCFSVIFKRPMIVFPNVLRGTTRFTALGDITGLNSRFVYSFNEVLEKSLLEQDIDFDNIDARLQPEREAGIKWLEEALNAHHRQESAKTVALWKILEYDSKLDNANEQLKKLEDEKVQLEQRLRDIEADNEQKEAIINAILEQISKPEKKIKDRIKVLLKRKR